MDRLSRSLALCGMGVVLTASGCRSARPEVPPGRPYSNDGRRQPAIGFSSDPHPVDGSAMTNIVPDSPGAGRMAQGLNANSSRPDMSSVLGGDANGSYGPPGTSGRTDPNVGYAGGMPRESSARDEAILPAGAPDLPRQSIDPNPGGITPPASSSTLPANVAPQALPAPPASQVVQPELDLPGRMGRGNDLPSPY